MVDDPGYGPNGELRSPDGAVTWAAIGPAKPINPGHDVYPATALGLKSFPFIEQLDDDAWEIFGPLPEAFGVIDLALLLETGDLVRLETGDFVLLEA